MKKVSETKNDRRYSIVTPARNEEATLNLAVESVVNQTIKPGKWIILNDASTDRTGEILDSYAEKHDWIEVIHVEKKVKTYAGIQQKLEMAFKKIDLNENEFIGKLDSDIVLNPTYYEDIMEKFHKNPKLGIAAGILYHIAKNKEVIERNPPRHVRGGLIFYRVQCWKDIGGMDPTPEYDTIDGVKASMLGWETRCFEEIKARHLRPTSHYNTYALGKAAYMIGYHPLFLISKSLRYMVTEKPYLFGGLAMSFGFLRCYIDKTERTIKDEKFIKYLRRQQMERLLGWRS